LYFREINSITEFYTKLFQSKIYHSEDGSTWFFVAFKKNYLIDKTTIIIKEKNENFIAEKLFPDEDENNNN
jgi:predicted transcriptional regulator YheO